MGELLCFHADFVLFGADLAKVDKKTPIIVFSHPPLYKMHRPWNFWTANPFRLTERSLLQFSAESVNAANHPNFGLPVSDPASPAAFRQRAPLASPNSRSRSSSG